MCIGGISADAFKRTRVRQKEENMEQSKLEAAKKLLQKEFGADWETIAQILGTENLRKRVGKELTTFMAFPERGEGGSSKWRGNCSPEVVKAIAKYCLDCRRYDGKTTDDFVLLDPMSGSGTSKFVADDLGIQSILYDLNPNPTAGRGNWNALKDEVDASADLIFWHPPYHDIIRYSGDVWKGKPHPDDLSRCENWADFIEKINEVTKKLYFALRNGGRLAILVGDIRSKGQFYSMQNDMMRVGKFDSFIVKGQYNCVSDSRTYRKPFIPIVTEYLLVMQKDNPIVVQFSKRLNGVLDISSEDAKALTWFHLVRSTLESFGASSVELPQLYAKLASHPKATKNPNWQARIRATVYEHPETFHKEATGRYKLAYSA